MALIGPESTCAICNGALDRPYTATSGVAFACSSRLWAYCDAPLHFDCLATWPDREEFSRAYFVSGLATYWSGYGTLLSVTPEWFLGSGPGVGSNLTTDPSREPHFARVELARWPFTLYSKWGEWDAFVDGGYRDELFGPALDVADAVMARVREEAPTLEALRALRRARSTRPPRRASLVDFGRYLETFWGMAARRIDWQTLEDRRQAIKAAEAERQRTRSERISSGNAIARRLVIKLANGGQLVCPHCRRSTREMRFVDREPDAESYFVCRLCGRSFSGAERWEDR